MKKYNYVNYIHFGSIESTNTWVKANMEMLDPNQMTCVTAKEQTAGRGRFQRKWISCKDLSICATYYFSLPTNTPVLSNLGQILCISCCQTLKELGFSPQCKWPNDILIDRKKIAGFLCETRCLDDNRIGVALGIGINVNLPEELLKDIDQEATSLKALSQKDWSTDEILSKISNAFLRNLNLLGSAGFEPFCHLYDELLAFKGEPVVFEDGNRLLKGKCHRVSDKGSLILLSDEGEEIEVTAGTMVHPKKAAL